MQKSNGYGDFVIKPFFFHVYDPVKVILIYLIEMMSRI